MDNEISKAIKRKTDAQMRMNATDITPVVNEGVGNTTIINDPSKYIIPMVAGQNVTIGTSGSNKVINALMNILAGDNITVTEPDENGAVTVSANIGGKAIDLTGLMDGYVLKYDSLSDSFVVSEVAGAISQATENDLGGVKAKARTTENAEVAIDETTGKLYAPAGGAELTQATETTLGGVKAKEKTTETAEVAIDSSTGKLYVPPAGEAENGLPAGGTAGQVLTKVDWADYNAEWADISSNVMSTSEKVVGRWIDGKLIYRKTIVFGALPSNTTPKKVPHNVSNVGLIISLAGFAHNGPTAIPIPFSHPTASSAIELFCNSSDISIHTGIDRSVYSVCYVTMEYTKTI